MESHKSANFSCYKHIHAKLHSRFKANTVPHYNTKADKYCKPQVQRRSHFTSDVKCMAVHSTQHSELENTTIANALQLEAPRHRASPYLL